MKYWTHPASSFPWVTPATKRQNIWSSFIYSFFWARQFHQKLWFSLIYFFYLHATIRPLIYGHLLFILSFANDHSTKIYCPISFTLSFVHNNSTKNYGPHWCISFICIRPFNQNIWSSFIYSFLCAREFDHRLWPTLTDFFYLHMTIRRKTRGLTDLFRLFLHDHSTQIYGPLSFILSFVHDNKLWSSLTYFFYLPMTIWPKYRSSFIYSFFCGRPFDYQLGVLLI